MTERIGYNPYFYSYPQYLSNNVGVSNTNRITPSFRGDSIGVASPQTSVNYTTPPDTVEISAGNKINEASTQEKQKTGISTGAKWALGLSSVLALGIGAKIGTSKYLKNLVNKKLVPSNLPEHIEFKDATSLDEAYKYLREVLKIKDVDENMSLDVLNYINNALTRVSNFHNGKVVFPTKIRLMNLNKDIEGAIAGVSVNPFSKDFGSLDIDKNYFDIQTLDSYLKKHLFKKDGSKKYGSRNFMNIKSKNVIYKTSDELQDLIESFYKSPNSLTMKQKMDLRDSIENFYERLHYNKFDKIKNINGNDNKIFYLNKTNSELTIYHELGHLQDYACKIPQMGLGYLRYGFVNNEDTKSVFNLIATKQAKEFQNYKNQEIAKKVSEYSKKGIAEFIAETYARALNGDKLPEDVIALYKKYGGPKIPFA